MRRPLLSDEAALVVRTALERFVGARPPIDSLIGGWDLPLLVDVHLSINSVAKLLQVPPSAVQFESAVPRFAHVAGNSDGVHSCRSTPARPCVPGHRQVAVFISSGRRSVGGDSLVLLVGAQSTAEMTGDLFREVIFVVRGAHWEIASVSAPMIGLPRLP
jgi:hypothetical protein